LKIARGFKLLKTISVTVDTEEEGLWGGAYPIWNCTTHNLRGLARFQSLCDRYGTPPTYLVDAPVLEDSLAVKELSGWHNAGLCEIGTHCHPWCNPPIVSESVSTRDSYLCNLPEEVQFEKLKWLTDRIANTFGRSPTAYRAGRYGFNQSSVKPLVDLNYKLDSSVLPEYDYRTSEGPSFRSLSRNACFVGDTSGSKKIMEVPITTGFTRSGAYRQRQAIRRWVETPLGRATKLAAIANRLGVCRHVKLSPEGTSLAELKGLVESSLRDGVNHLVLMLHSTSLMPGFSPYAKDAAGVEGLYQRLGGILDFTIKEHQCVGVGLSEIPKWLPANLPEVSLASATL
jgi:hypothetical protein